MKTILLWDPRFPDRRPARLTVEDTVASAAVRAGVAAAADPAEAGALSAGGPLDPATLTEVVLQHGTGTSIRRVFLPYSVVLVGAAAGVLASIGTPIPGGVTPTPTPTPAPSFTSQPSITGTPMVGLPLSSLTFTDGAVANGSVTARAYLLAGAAKALSYVVLSTDVGAALTFQNTATGTDGSTIVASSAGVAVAPGVPTMAFSTPAVSIAEGNSGTTTVPNTITIDRKGVTGALTINLTYGGTATSGTDYVAGPTSGTVAAGSSTLVFDIVVNGDTGSEATETIIINAALAGYSTTASKTITISDDDTVSANAPAQNWRMATTAATDSGGDTALQTAMVNAGSDKSLFPVFTVASGATRSITLDVAAVAAPGGLAYFIPTVEYGVVAERSFDGGATWSAISYTPQFPGSSNMTNRGQFISIPAGAASKVRLAFTNATTAAGTVNLKLHQRPATGRSDTWIVHGASLEQGPLASIDMLNKWRAQFPSYDPCFTNYAVGGATTAQVRNYTEQAVAALPMVDFYLLDCGGNDISTGRPYATDAGSADASYTAMVTAVQGAGKVALPSRVTYRNYPSDPAVDGANHQENGSLPYNLNQYDPMIRTKVPDTYDFNLNIPRMDWYSLCMRYREELSDGVHHGPALITRGIALWSDVFGRFVYTGAWPVPLSEQFVAEAEATSNNLLYYRAKEVVDALPTSPGKTALTNRLVALTSVPSVATAPALVGTFAVGEPVGTNGGTWNGFPFPTYTYQTYVDGVLLAGADTASRALVAADQGKTFRWRVTATNDRGSTSADTPVSAAVAASGGQDALTTAFIARMPVKPDTAFSAKIDALMKVVKGMSLDSFVVYGMHDTSAKLLDWFNDNHNHSFLGSTNNPTFTAFQGLTGSGAAGGSIRFGRSTSTMGAMSQNSASIAFGVRTFAGGALAGSSSTPAAIYALGSSARMMNTTSGSYAWAVGNYVMTRRSADEFTIRKDQVAPVTIVQPSVPLDTNDITMLRSGTSYGASQLSWAAAGPALTPAQEQALIAAVAAFFS